MPKDRQSFGILIKVLQAYIVNMSKLQHFRADSVYLGKNNTKKKFQFFFHCLALPKDPQSFGSKNFGCPFLVSQYYSGLMNDDSEKHSNGM